MVAGAAVGHAKKLLGRRAEPTRLFSGGNMGNAKLDDLFAHQTGESIMIRLESFADEFERVERTAKQGVLAESFKNAVHDIAKDGPLSAAHLEQLGDWLNGYVDGFERLASTSEQKELVASFSEFAKEITGPAVKDVFQKALVNELADEITMAMAEGSSNGVPFARLSREGKEEFLSDAIDWTDYIDRGLEVSIGDETTYEDIAGIDQTRYEGIACIIDNAIAGKPSEQWMARTGSLAEPGLVAGDTGMGIESYTAEGLAALSKEIRADEAARKREDEYGKDAYQEILDGMSKAPAAGKAKDKGIER
jgi:hypothetical protein